MRHGVRHEGFPDSAIHHALDKLATAGKQSRQKPRKCHAALANARLIHSRAKVAPASETFAVSEDSRSAVFVRSLVARSREIARTINNQLLRIAGRKGAGRV